MRSRLRRSICIAVFALAASCGSNENGGSPGDSGKAASTLPPIHRSGSRLRAKRERADGGADVFVSFHDTQLGVDCAVAPAEDGKERCLPTAATSLVLFRDAACVAPVIAAHACDDGLYAQRLVHSPTCDASRFEVYERGEKLSFSGSALYAKQPDGTCIAYSTDRPIHAAKKIEPAKFALFTERAVPIGPVTANVLESEDGAAVIASLVDSARKEACSIGSASTAISMNDALRCLPARTAYSRGFVDAACTQPAAYAVDDCDPPPSVATLFDKKGAEGCWYFELRWAALGKPVASPYDDASGFCMPRASSGSDSQHFELGAPVAPSTFPEATRVFLGTGRLRGVRYAIDGKPLAEWRGGFFDTVTNGPCTPTSFSDGTRRCVGGAIVSISPAERELHADASCTQRLVRVPHPGGCDVRTPTHAVFSRTDSCGSVVEHVRALTPRATVKYWVRAPGDTACMEANALPLEDFYSVGPDASPDDVFARVTEVVE